MPWKIEMLLKEKYMVRLAIEGAVDPGELAVEPSAERILTQRQIFERFIRRPDVVTGEVEADKVDNEVD